MKVEEGSSADDFAPFAAWLAKEDRVTY
jgi:hypothetical protein